MQNHKNFGTLDLLHILERKVLLSSFKNIITIFECGLLSSESVAKSVTQKPLCFLILE